MRHDRLPYILIPLAALIAVLPLMPHGCSCGHDFDFHIVSWLEAARQFAHGNLHPHWTYSPAYNAGEPRFIFYPPLSWTIGALLGLVLPWTWVPILYTWLALTGAGLAMHRLAREFAAPASALIAAVLYTVNPYMLFTAYERTAYAELLAASWIPILLHAMLRRRIGVTELAVPVALLWLTNAPAAVMSCYALALVALVRIVSEAWNRQGRTQQANGTNISTNQPRLGPIAHITWNTFAGTALGLALAAIYIVPAAYERRFVQTRMAVLPGMRIVDNFLFTHTSDPAHDTVLHTASMIAVLLLVLTALFLAMAGMSAKGSKDPRHRTALQAMAVLSAAIAFMQTPLSLSLWHYLPDLPFLQFPWRMIAIVAPVMFLAAAIACDGIHWRPLAIPAALPFVVAAMIWPAYSLFHQYCDPEDTVASQLVAFRAGQGSEPTDEYTPIVADNDSLAQKNPPFWLAPDANAKAPATTLRGPAASRLAVESPIPQNLIVNLRNYPGWQIMINGTTSNMREQRDDGLIAFPIPNGRSEISISWKTTWDQAAGEVLSGVALLAFLCCRRRSSHTKL